MQNYTLKKKQGHKEIAMSYYKCSYEMHNVCVNNALCHLCDGKRLFKDPIAERKAKEEAKKQKEIEKKNALLKTKKDEKEGMAFEKRVQKKWNSTVTSGGSNQKKRNNISKPRIEVDSGEAKRFGNASGSLWFAKGDVTLDHALLECKERGTVNAKGEKQITIPKEWLDKLEVEAYKGGKDYWYLPFGFKNSEDIYLVKSYEHEMQLIQEVRTSLNKIEELEKKIKELEGEQ